MPKGDETIQLSMDEQKDPASVLQIILKAAFPDGVPMPQEKDARFEIRANVSTDWSGRGRTFDGVIVQATDSRYRKITRNIMLHSRRFNLDALRRAAKELVEAADCAARSREERRRFEASERDARDFWLPELGFTHYGPQGSVEGKFKNDSLRITSGYTREDVKFELTLRTLTPEQVREIMDFLVARGIRKVA